MIAKDVAPNDNVTAASAMKDDADDVGDDDVLDNNY